MNKLCGRRHHQSCDKKKRAVWGNTLPAAGVKPKERGENINIFVPKIAARIFFL